MMSDVYAQDAGSPWMKVLQESQDEISRLRPHPYYLSAYRQQEYSYWHHIPRWIYQDVLERSPQNCLDIGCAYGTLLLYVKLLTDCEAYGLDFMGMYMSPALVEKYLIYFQVNNIELDPFPWTCHYDTIIFTEVLEHFNFHALPTLRKLCGLLSDDGKLYLSTPDSAQWGKTTKYYTDYKSMPYPSVALRHRIVDDHVWQFSEDELLEVLDASGFEVVRFDLAVGSPHRHFNLTLQRK